MSTSKSLRFQPDDLLGQLDYLESLRFETEGVAETHLAIARGTRAAIDAFESAAAGVDFLSAAVRNLIVVEESYRSTGGQLADLSDRVAEARRLGDEMSVRLRAVFTDLLGVEGRIQLLRSEYDDQALMDGHWGVGWIEERLNGALPEIKEHIRVLERSAETHVNNIKSLEDEWRTRLSKILIGNSIDPRRTSNQRFEATVGITKDRRATSLWGSDGRIEAGDVNQLQLGDCFFASSVAGLASSEAGKSLLRRMIRDNGDGTYTVTFSRGRSVTVDADSWVGDDGQMVTSKPGPDGALWYSVLEEAYAEMKGGYTVLDGGGYSAEVFEDLGLSSWSYGTSVPSVFGVRVMDQLDGLDIDELDRRLSRITAGGTGTVSFQSGHSEWYEPGFHTLTLVKYDPETRVVTMRNPWGVPGFLIRDLPTHLVPSLDGKLAKVQDGIDWSSDGTCTMTLDTLRRVGTDMTIVEAIPDV